MGIKNLNKFIRDNYPKSIITCEFSTFRFKKIAIDTPILMYKYKIMNESNVDSVDYNKYNWVWSFLHLIHSFREADIHPVFIFEGKSPLEKKETQNTRRQTRSKVTEKTKDLKESISSLIDGNCVTPNHILIRQWEKILKQNNIPLDCPFDINIVSSSIQSRHRYDIDITKKDYSILKILLKILSVNYIQAPGEAEAYCAVLEQRQYVDAVISTDTDLLAYGCKKLIVKQENKSFQYIDLDILLECMYFSKPQFLDFCIMCGTDFNPNILGIGIKKSFNLISQHKTIDALNERGRQYNTSILNYIRVREIFTTFGNIDSKDIVIPPFCSKANISLLIYFKRKLNQIFDPLSLIKGFNITSATFDPSI